MAVFTPEFIAQCRRFMELRDARDSAKLAATKAENEYREAEAEIWEELAPQDPNDPDYKLTPQKVPLGPPYGTVTFGPRETVYARVIDSDAAQEHYENRALIDEVSAPKFVMKRLNEEVRELQEQGKDMPPGLDYYTNRFVSITRPK